MAGINRAMTIYFVWSFRNFPMSSISPLAPTSIPDMPVIAGVRLATAAAGIRYQGRTDVLLALLDQGTSVAGVFTKSKCPSAPVDWCRAKLKRGEARALVVNSGNANAFTGKTGRQATVLAFVLTDAPVSAGVLQSLLKGGVEDTFNAVTVDGDTSTSDTLLAFATGTAAANGAPKISRAGDPRLKAFTKAFRAVLADLAEQVARDGEGARKLVEIIVEGAVSKASARRIAMSVANSPLVKTAIAGEDANWGRVVMAVGKAGEPANRDKLAISFNGIRVAKSGARDPSYNEEEASSAMKNPKIQIRIALGLGKGRDRVLTCDLTKEYIAINGDYRS